MPKIPEGPHVTLTTHLEQYPALRPFAGLIFEAYLTRADVGSGIRVFCVSQVGHKWVHLFYAPQLHSFKMRPSEFRAVFKRPILEFNDRRYKMRVRNKIAEAQRFNYQYSEQVTDRVLSLELSSGLNEFMRAAKHPLRIKTVRT